MEALPNCIGKSYKFGLPILLISRDNQYNEGAAYL